VKIRTVRQGLQQPSVFEEQPPQFVGDRENHVAMRDIQQPIFCLFRGFRRRSLPAHGTEPGFTGERDMAGLSAFTPQHRKTRSVGLASQEARKNLLGGIINTSRQSFIEVGSTTAPMIPKNRSDRAHNANSSERNLSLKHL